MIPRSIWVVACKDRDGNPSGTFGPWHHETRASARALLRTLNTKGSWLRLTGFRAFLVGEYRLTKPRRAR